MSNGSHAEQQLRGCIHTKSRGMELLQSVRGFKDARAMAMRVLLVFPASPKKAVTALTTVIVTKGGRGTGGQLENGTEALREVTKSPDSSAFYSSLARIVSHTTGSKGMRKCKFF